MVLSRSALQLVVLPQQINNAVANHNTGALWGALPSGGLDRRGGSDFRAQSALSRLANGHSPHFDGADPACGAIEQIPLVLKRLVAKDEITETNTRGT